MRREKPPLPEGIGRTRGGGVPSEVEPWLFQPITATWLLAEKTTAGQRLGC